MIRSPAIALLPLLAALAGCGGNDASGTVDQAAPGMRTLPVQALEIHPRDLSRVIEVSSTVEPMRSVRLAARTDGVLTEVRVEEGDRVEAGQELAVIDVSEQRAELMRARASLEEKRTAYERMKQLRERNYIDPASYETARAELAIAEAEVELWETRVGFGSVRASLSGMVVERYVEPGEAIARHEPLFTLADLDTQVVRLGVSELDVGGIREGQEVTVRIDAASQDNPLTGTVRRIFPAAEADSRLVTVEVELPGAAERGVRAGFLARAELVVDRREDVLAVLAGSVARTPEGEHYVMVINGEGRLEQRIIDPGIARGLWREVRAGLEPGERVVASNPLELSEGTAVRIVSWAG